MENTMKKFFNSARVLLGIFAGFLSVHFAMAQTQYSGYVYFVKDNNLWVNDLSTDTSSRLTRLEIAIGAGVLTNPSISSDGTKIIFSYKANTGSETLLYCVNNDGSGLENLSSTQQLLSQTKNQISGILSPDMTKLAFTAEMRNPGPFSGRQLWLKELTGLKRLMQLTLMDGDCSDVQFLDDSHIIFKHKLGYLEDYYLISTTGSNLTNLTNNSAFEPYFPRLGRPMLNNSRSSFFYATQTQSASGYSNWKICRYDVQSGSSTDVQTNLFFTEQPLFQDDPQPVSFVDSTGTDTAFVFIGRNPLTQTKMLYLTQIGAANPYARQISDSSGAIYPIYYPVKARPTLIVYTSGLPSQVYLRDASDQLVQLTSGVSSNSYPVFDPTGSLIAYSGNGIWVMKADGTDPVQVESNFNAKYPAFSPDSKWVAYVISNDIYARKIDLSVSAVRLTSTSTTEKSDLCFSPDGTAIIYTGSTSSGRQIFSMPIKISSTSISATGPPVNLTQTPGSENFQPCFSPDGKKIVFVTTRDGSPRIYIMNSDGSGQSLLISQTGYYPQFSPWENDNRIAFVSGAVVIINLDTGTTETLSSVVPKDRFFWAKSISERVAVARQFIYNRIDPNLVYYYCLNISINKLNPPLSFIITEQLPTIAAGASANWEITGAWFNDVALFPLTSSGNTTGTVKWIVSNNIGSIFPLTDGTLKLKIEFQSIPAEGTWNFANGSVTDGTTRTMTKGDSYIVYGQPNCPSDTDGDWKISDSELLYTIDRWSKNLQIHGWPMNLSQWDFWLLKTIDFWAHGGYTYVPTTEPFWNSI